MTREPASGFKRKGADSLAAGASQCAFEKSDWTIVLVLDFQADSRTTTTSTRTIRCCPRFQTGTKARALLISGKTILATRGAVCLDWRRVNLLFSYPHWLWLLVPAWAWIIWLTHTSEVQLSPVRRWVAGGLRLVIVTALVLALAGFQWRWPVEGMNVFFVLDRSESVPSEQQEEAVRWINQVAPEKTLSDRAGVLVFATEAAIEVSPGIAFQLPQIQAVVPTDRTDIAGAIRLATAAFPEMGQRRMVLLSDGNENLDDAFGAAVSARSSGVSIDVMPLGAERDNEVSVRRLDLPSTVAKGQTFDVKVFVQAARAGPAQVQLYRDERFLGESVVQLEAGKNLFTFLADSR
jgi:Ca-activated chloride channel homolog